MKYLNRKTHTAGFTLIELLAAIAIISILSSILINQYNGARAATRDGVRLAELEQIQVAISLFRATNGHYPREADGANGKIGEGAGLDALLSSYMAKVPKDPKSDGGDYYYYYDGQHNCLDVNNVNTQIVIIFAHKMETVTSDQAETCPGGFGGEGDSNYADANHIIIGLTDG